MKKLCAKVEISRGNVKNVAGQWDESEFQQQVLPAASFLEIVEQHGAIYLLRLDADRKYIIDTWHETIGAAKQQAKFEFDIDDSDWTMS